MKQAGLLLFCCGAVCAQTSLRILPDTPLELIGTAARQQLLAEGADGRYQHDWTREAQWTSSNPQVATVNQTGLVLPVSDGEAVVTAKTHGETATATVRVQATHQPFTYSFRNHVIPVMSKIGCNQGACHGALAGKNGFKLTLRGYDPVTDYYTLTRQSDARRVSLAQPAASLMLLKPTMTIPHGGGRRFAVGSLEYKIISSWIAAGAPPPTDKDPRVTGLEVFPKAATLEPGATQQLVVLAKYNDGHSEDVTRWVKYNSNAETVASVDDSGRVKMNGQGEAAVTLWYSSRVLYSRLTVPYANKVTAEDYARFPRNNFVDDLVLAKLKTLNIAPSRPASDAEFIRRAYLDAAGILPTAEEVENFLADKSPDKRKKLIDALLERDEFTDYWAYKWSDLLMVSSRKLRTDAVWAFYDWIRESVKQNKPWNRFAWEVLTSSGSTRRNGALNYFVLHKDPIELTENASLAFLGQRVTCARCHNHPLEKWTQIQYYELANLFSRVGIKNGASPGDEIVFAKTSGDINHPKLGRPLTPTTLDGQSVPLDSPVDRRIVFAKWATSQQNPYFARTVVNRVWANFLGRGIVHPADDMRATNPASNEELLDALTKHFVAHGFDVKELIRTIMNSGTYQLSSEANATNQNDDVYYSKYIIKRLPAEVILDAMSQVTGVSSSFPGYPPATRALQLPDTRVASQFLTVFGRPPRLTCDVAERSSEPSISQALHVINGDTLNDKLRAANGNVNLFLKLGLSDGRILEYLYLSAFSRYPSGDDGRELTAALAKARLARGTPEAQLETRKEALQDMMWAMLTSKEFLFNH